MKTPQSVLKLTLPVLVVLAGMLIAFKATDRPVDVGNLFQAYLDEFPVATLPYTLDADKMRLAGTHYTYNSRISRKFKQFVNELDVPEYSRMGPEPQMAIALLSRTKDRAVVIYGNPGYDNGFYSDFKLVVYDGKGTTLSKQEVAGMSTEHIQEVKVDQALNVTTTTYNLKWNEQLVDVTGYGPDALDSKEVSATVCYHINRKGELTEVAIP
jgi:hypothetical protein